MLISKSTYDKIINHYWISKSDLIALFNKYNKFKKSFKWTKTVLLKQIYLEHYTYLKNVKMSEYLKLMNFIIFKNEVI